MGKPWSAIVVVGLLLLGGEAVAQPVRVTVVAQDGDVLPGTSQPVSYLFNPFTNGLGEIGFLGRLADDDQFIFIADTVVWVDSDETTLDLGYSDYYSMGFSDAGGWIYAPEADDASNLDGIYSHNGIMLAQGDAAPGYIDATIQALFRPIMLPGGAAFFVANVDTDGDGLVEERALYVSPTASDDDLTVFLHTGDMVGGYALDQYAITNTLYDISSDGTQLIAVVDLVTGSSTNDGGILVGGVLAMQEGSATGDGDNWGYFDLVSVNNAGHYVVSGDTGGDSTTDEFIAYDGVIAIREGDLVDGVSLGTPANVNGLSLNDDGQVAFWWRHSSGMETLFFACDGSDLAGTAQKVLRIGDFVDVDGDGFTDARVTDFNGASDQGPSLNLGSGNLVYIEVDLDYGAGEVEAILAVPVTCCGNGVTDEGEACDDGGESATCDADCTAVECGDHVVNASAGEGCDEGEATATCDGDCTVVECGDGTINAAAGEVCDDEGESAICNADCTTAACGDQVVNATAGEACDDGDQTIFCDGDCTVVECGDGTLNTGVGEVCDDGGESATCNADCTIAACGDGVYNPTAGEACDFAGEHALCDADCSAATCGDGTVNAAAGEACDDGAESATCDRDCTAPLCGDGLVNPAAGESCEDGNGEDGDGCSAACQLEGDSGNGGCGCRAGGRTPSQGPWGLLVVALCGVALRRRSGRLKAAPGPGSRAGDRRHAGRHCGRRPRG